LLVKVSRIVFIDSSNNFEWIFCLGVLYLNLFWNDKISWRKFSSIFSKLSVSRRGERVEIVGWWLCTHSTYSTVPRIITTVKNSEFRKNSHKSRAFFLSTLYIFCGSSWQLHTASIAAVVALWSVLYITDLISDSSNIALPYVINQ